MPVQRPVSPPGERWCWKCKAHRPLAEFGKNAKCRDGLQLRCLPCSRALNREHYDANGDAMRARGRSQWLDRPRRPQRHRGYYLKKAYGLTVAQYDEMVAACGGKCAVCGRIPRERERLHVDHNHTTGKVRGLLCNQCNAGIGLLGDAPEGLRRAIEYLTAAEGENGRNANRCNQ